MVLSGRFRGVGLIGGCGIRRLIPSGFMGIEAGYTVVGGDGGGFGVIGAFRFFVVDLVGYIAYNRYRFFHGACAKFIRRTLHHYPLPLLPVPQPSPLVGWLV